MSEASDAPDVADEVKSLRVALDQLDLDLVELIVARCAVVGLLQQRKAGLGMPSIDVGRAVAVKRGARVNARKFRAPDHIVGLVGAVYGLLVNNPVQWPAGETDVDKQLASRDAVLRDLANRDLMMSVLLSPPPLRDCT